MQIQIIHSKEVKKAGDLLSMRHNGHMKQFKVMHAEFNGFGGKHSYFVAPAGECKTNINNRALKVA